MTVSLQKIETPLAHELVPPQRPAELHPTVLLLHGRGASAADLLPLTDELGSDELLSIGVQAPWELRGAFGLGYAWYHLREIGEPDEASFRQSLTKLQAFLDAIVKGYPVDPSRLFLLGFSQGAVMSLALGLNRPDRIAGIVALSGYLADLAEPAGDAELQGLPVFIGHGIQDDLLGVHLGREARDALRPRGVELSYHEYPAGHTIIPDEVADIRAWLQPRLEGNA